MRDGLALIGDELPGETDEVARDELTHSVNPASLLPADCAARLALHAAVADGTYVGIVRFDEPLARHTTLKIGGPADVYLAPANAEAMAWALGWARAAHLPVTVIGGGSNLLVRDGGVRGVVVTTKGMRTITRVGPALLGVESGVSTGKVLATATEYELGGVEFLGGVPGTVGGGLIMNAGTYVGEFKSVAVRVDSVRIADGVRVQRDNAMCGFGYRHSALPADEIVVYAELALHARPRAEIVADVKALRQRRHEREPLKVSSNGSTFKNPPGQFAGRLIEAAGCKGWHEGDAVCSPVHANWLVNTGHATATQLLALIDRVRVEVLRVHGVALELEVKIIGDN